MTSVALQGMEAGMSELPATRVYQRIRNEQPAPSGGVARVDLYLADAAVDELLARIAELEADLAESVTLDVFDRVRGENQHERDRAETAEAARDNMMQEMYERLEQAEDVLAERDRQWEKLRGEIRRETKHGIDLYVRRNAKDFMKMMDRARAEQAEAAKRDRIVEYDVAREKWMRKKLADLRSRVRGK